MQPSRASEDLPDVLDTTQFRNLGLASRSSPLALEQFEAEIRNHLQIPDSHPLPGARLFCPGLRQRARDRLFVADKGHIPEKQRFREVLPCWRAHPGVCRQDDVYFYECIISVACGIFDFVKSMQPGTFLMLQCVGCTQQIAACLSYTRGAGPKLAIFTLGDWAGGKIALDHLDD